MSRHGRSRSPPMAPLSKLTDPDGLIDFSGNWQGYAGGPGIGTHRTALFQRHAEPGGPDGPDSDSSLRRLVLRPPRCDAGLVTRSNQRYQCWAEISAGQGSGEAQWVLATYFGEGKNGLPVDPDRAFALAVESARNGSVHGASYLATLYREGRGTPKDEEKAVLWDKRSQALERQLNARREADRKEQEQESRDLALLRGIGQSRPALR